MKRINWTHVVAAVLAAVAVLAGLSSAGPLAVGAGTAAIALALIGQL